MFNISDKGRFRRKSRRKVWWIHSY